MAMPTEITVSQLSKLIGTPSSPTIIDVCIDEDFNLDRRVIPTAGRVPHQYIGDLSDELLGKKAVVYCQKGKKISRGAAAILRAQGVNAESLEGGFHAWRDAGAPLIPFDKLSSLPTAQRNPTATLWVTRHRPKIDRIACPWLIRRFIDPSAEFLFVAPSDVLLVAEKFNATPFDVADCHFAHQDKGCTFDTFLSEFQLETEPLTTMTRIIRGADLGNHDLAPEAPGLHAFSVGLSRMFRDDLLQLEAGLTLYDALFRWARDGQNETHDAASHVPSPQREAFL